MNSPFADRNRLSVHPREMRRVVVESPYAGDIEANVAYARACIRDCLLRDEAPFASHLIYTQPGIMDDTNNIERAVGINTGHAWMHGCHAVVVYTDRGISKGMEAGIRTAEFHKIPIEYRNIPGYAAAVITISSKLSEEDVARLRSEWEKSMGGVLQCPTP